MKAFISKWDTSLTVADAASWFRGTAESMYQSSGSRKMTGMVLGGKGLGLNFFTPQREASPFDAFEAHEDFAVGVRMPKGGFVGGATPITVQMYVTDRGERREIRLAAPYSMGEKKGAETFIRRFEAGLAGVDPGARPRS